MAYAVIVNMNTATKFYRFEYKTEDEAKVVIKTLECAMQGIGKACVRIQDSVIRVSAVDSVHLLPASENQPS